MVEPDAAVGIGGLCGEGLSLAFDAVADVEGCTAGRTSSSALRFVPRGSSSVRVAGAGVMAVVLVSGDLLGAIVRRVSAAS